MNEKRVKCNGELISDGDAELYRRVGFRAGFYCPADVRNAISTLSPGEELVLEINSVGGYVKEANEIYSALEGCKNPTRAEIQSLAASAASYFPLACNRVEIHLPAQMMIHQGWVFMEGNKEDHRWVADQLEVADEATLDVYCKKCGDKSSREELRELMNKATYLSSHRCLELGLVDAVLGELPGKEPDEQKPMAFAASVTGNIIKAMTTLPPVAELKAKLEREQAWKADAQAELNAEKNRDWKG